MIDFKLIIILVMGIALYILFNMLDKTKSHLNKLEENIKEHFENDEKKQYLDNFYDSNSDTNINNISVLEETTEPKEEYYVEEPPHFIEQKKNIENTNDESIKQCFDDHQQSHSESLDFDLDSPLEEPVHQNMITYSNQEEDKKLNIDIDIDKIMNDDEKEVSQYISSIANSKPTDELNVEVSYSDEEKEDDKKQDNVYLDNIRKMILNESVNKYKLAELQKIAEELNIRTEKELNGKTKNKTKNELWKEISNNIK